MFQYVSIISVSTIPSRILFPRFTFQYVSIISQQCQKEAQFTAIYIPICFYYFPSIPSALIPSGSSFTFQYVSIISRFPFLATLITYIFTFQYVSIISVHSRTIDIVRSKFTFQYVSIISLRIAIKSRCN